MIDENNPEWTDEMFAEAISSKEFLAKKIGRPTKDNKKIPISFRIDPDLLKVIKSTGSGWQSRIHSELEKIFL